LRLSARAAIASQYFAVKLSAITIVKILVRNAETAYAAARVFRAKIAGLHTMRALLKVQALKNLGCETWLILREKPRLGPHRKGKVGGGHCLCPQRSRLSAA
jgi:hypothetical protein